MIAAIQRWWKAEATRHFLWLPVCFGAGIGIYWGLPEEPAPWLLPAIAGAILVLTLLLRKRALPLMLALLLIALGAAWANVLTVRHHPVILHESLEPRPVSGTVRDIERTEHGVRIILDQVKIEDLAPEETPTRVRLSVRLKKDSDLALPAIGDQIQMMAGMMTPMGPALPHGFDFARFFYFRDLGAVGYGLPPWVVVAPEPEPGLASRFMNWRLKVTEDIIATLGTGVGGVAAGLITGDARAITEADYNNLRASNLYHIIAISGEHMVVIAGVIFVTLRMLGLLLLPARLKYRPQVKSFSAVVTLVLVTIYLFVTGLPVSAIRAYVMITLVLLAVIFRRQVDPMRSLAITALIMLAVSPANLLDPGFQLSFAATLAIIALVEAAVLSPHAMLEQNRLQRTLRLIATMFLVSVVAEAATTPLVIAQFNNVSPYGVFANMMATPLVSLFLMPTVALFFILLPFGLQHAALWLMKYGIMALMGIAKWIASFPHAQLFSPSIPGYGVALFALGLVWVCLWRTRVRVYGSIAMVLGVATLLFTHPPDMLVGGNLKQVAFNTDEGYVLARGRVTSMLPELWANGLGHKELEPAGPPNWRCDKLGCVARVKGQLVAFPYDAAALLDDCRHAQVVVTGFADVKCSTNTTVLGGAALAKSNVTAVWFEDGGTRIETSAEWQGKRPWSAAAEDDGDE